MSTTARAAWNPTIAARKPHTDADLDGYIDVACGGTDCDDSDPNINPGRVEIPGDGIDSNCDGADSLPVPVPDSSWGTLKGRY